LLALRTLVQMKDEQLGRVPIEEVQLACSVGLPGSENIDQAECFNWVRHAAWCVADFTKRNRDDFLSHPEKYQHSVAYFCCLCLTTVLWKYLGVRYNPAKMHNGHQGDIDDVFIHGPIFGEGGICASLGPLYAAVGRRLGWPIRLGHAFSKKNWCGHCFARWDDPNGERMNIEVCELGMSTPSDDYYRTGIYEVTEREQFRCWILRSATPRQELAYFLGERALLWLDADNYREAANSFAWALALSPENVLFYNRVVKTLNDWRADLNRRIPPRFPKVIAEGPTRHFPKSVPFEFEGGLVCFEIEEKLLANREYERRWWAPLRAGQDVDAPILAKGTVFPDKPCEVRFQFGPMRPLC
jgi:hypothetical protein